MSVADGFNRDFLDILEALDSAGVEYLVVGAHAMALHGVPRATGDLDLWVRPSPENADRVLQALRTFGAPLEAHGVTREDFATADSVYQIGLPPRRIDLLTSISGVSFAEAWPLRESVRIAGRDVPFLSLGLLVKNKRASGREKDTVDVRLLTRGR